jgi:hypothetical protein
MPNALIRVRFASAIVRSDPTGWNMPWKRTGSPVYAVRDDVLDVEVDGVSNTDAVPQPVVVHLDRSSLDANDLADKGR